MRHESVGQSELPRRVALFVPALSGGGVQRVLLTMAAGLRDRGYAVDFLVVNRRGAFADHVPEGVRLVELGQRFPGHGRMLAAWLGGSAISALAKPLLASPSPGQALAGFPDLVGYLRSSQPAVLFSTKVDGNLVALLARRAADASGRVVVSERETYEAKVRYGRRWRWRHVAPAIRRVYPEADAIVAVSQGTADSFARVTGRTWPALRVIHNPVVGPELDAQARADPGHTWLASDRDAPVILGVGRLETRKGFDVLIRALARVRAGRPARLVVLGEGPDRAALERLAHAEGVADAVDLPGWQANPFAFMARADLFVLSSDYEGLPGALIQAMACGCPVVSTDCPDGPREILADGTHGTLVPPRDADALARAITHALATPADFDALRARAADFRIETALDAYEALFREVLAHDAGQSLPADP